MATIYRCDKCKREFTDPMMINQLVIRTPLPHDDPEDYKDTLNWDLCDKCCDKVNTFVRISNDVRDGSQL